MDAQALNKTLHDLAVERFGADGIARTEMGERVGYYGDPLLEARVVLTAEPEDADVEALVSFPLQLMRHLEGLGEGRFVMTRFISASDAGELAA